MANQLDEMNPEIMAEGRDVHVIAKVIPVETSGFEKLIPTILMAIGVIAIVLGDSYRQVPHICYRCGCTCLSLVAIKTN